MTKRVAVLVVSLCIALSAALVLTGCSAQSQYTPQKKDQQVSDSALKTAATLTVGVDASNAPYAAESQGAIVGIDVDVAAALADELGLKLELVDVGSNVTQALSNKEVDIVMGVTSTDSAYWTSKPYMDSAIVLFSQGADQSAPSSQDVFSVAAQASSMSALEVTDRLGKDHLEEVTDVQSAFEQLSSGSANYVATDSTIGSYVALAEGIDAHPVALLQDPTSYRIAAASTSTGLQQSIESALDALLSGGVITVVDQKWLGSPYDLSSLTVINKLPSATTQTQEPAEVGTATNAITSSNSSNSNSSNSNNSSSNSSSSSSSSRTSGSSSSSSSSSD